MRVLAAAGYGWTEFIEHTSCADPQDFPLFFRRAGAWLALFHAFVGVDMHQENIVATGSHPVPIDLEMMLQAADAGSTVDDDDAGAAYASAMQSVLDSVLTVGLLPAYGRHSTSKVFAIGGVTLEFGPSCESGLDRHELRRDAAAPRCPTPRPPSPTCPTSTGAARSLGDHIDDLIAGFGEYARFLQRQPATSPRAVRGLDGPQDHPADPVLRHAADSTAGSPHHG